MVKVPPLRMEVKFRNNIILRKMEERGLKSVSELCRQANLHEAKVGEIVNMKELPRNRNGSWRPIVTRLANFFGCLPEDLFSPEQLETKLELNRGHAEVTFGQVHALLAVHEAERLLPEAVVERAELKQLLGNVLKQLKPRHAQVLRMLYGMGGACEHTPAEIAEALNVTPERIRQIERRALRDLRHSGDAPLLRHFLGDPEQIEKSNRLRTWYGITGIHEEVRAEFLREEADQ